jgi:hypothetical protein
MFERSDAANGHGPVLALHANSGSGKAAIEGNRMSGRRQPPQKRIIGGCDARQATASQWHSETIVPIFIGRGAPVLRRPD